MAGAGYKLFNTGDVLTAAQVNTYLQEQVVMVFADATARTTALSGVLAEGMVSYLKDTNATEVYDGSAWVGIGNSGDITGVTAGTGISGGGTSGTVTITNDMATTITAAGDIVVGTGSGTYDNLPIGTTGQVLTADTTVSPYKVKWASASSSFVGASVKRAGVSTAITGGADLTIAYTTEEFDTDGFHDNSTNNTRITIPTGKGGKYLLSVNFNNNGGSPGSYQILSLKKNGSSYTAGGTTGTYFRTNSGAQDAPVGFSTIVEAAAGDYFEVIYTQANSATVTVYSNFSVGYLGA